MKKILPFFFVLIISAIVSVSASADYRAELFDDADVLSDVEESVLLSEMQEASELHGMNIGVVITADKGGKGSMDFADDYYDNVFGINTDGILLLLDNDEQEDWISTSGRALDDYYSDYAIEKIFDNFYAPLHEGDFFGTIEKFIEGCEEYKWVEGVSFNLDTYDEDDYRAKVLSSLSIGIIVAVITIIIARGVVKASYRGGKGVAPEHYNVKEQLYYRENLDLFVREYTTSVSASSSSHSSGGGSRHSSHRSSGGGRHGGGGRHR